MGRLEKTKIQKIRNAGKKWWKNGRNVERKRRIKGSKEVMKNKNKIN